MVSINKVGGQSITKACELYGLSTDTKPTQDIPNGSSFYEMDTQTLSLFDEENKMWRVQS